MALRRWRRRSGGGGVEEEVEGWWWVGGGGDGRGVAAEDSIWLQVRAIIEKSFEINNSKQLIGF